MLAEVRWEKRAGKHLEDIYDYLSAKSEQAAARCYNELLDFAEILREFPLAGKVEPALQDNPKCYRSLVACKHYKIIYRIDSNIVKIVAIWDCRQDSRKLRNKL